MTVHSTEEFERFESEVFELARQHARFFMKHKPFLTGLARDLMKGDIPWTAARWTFDFGREKPALLLTMMRPEDSETPIGLFRSETKGVWNERIDHRFDGQWRFSRVSLGLLRPPEFATDTGERLAFDGTTDLSPKETELIYWSTRHENLIA